MAPVASRFVIVLSPAERTVLTVPAHAARVAHRDVVRARIVLAADDGQPNGGIADDLGLHVDTVRKWRRRFAADGLDGLADLARSGRPRTFTPVQAAEVKTLACELPAESGVPLSRWSTADLAAQAVERGIVDAVSASTVRRWLEADAIKPWQHRSWIFPRDPDFATKAARVLDLYASTWQGRPLEPDEYVISADEKSQLQALQRRHPGLPPAPGRTRRIEFEYRRGGTLAFFAAYDVHHARVIGHIAPKTGIEPFTQLVEQVMTREPYASAKRVFWVVDNGSSHNGQASVDRMQNAWPTAELVHLPIYAPGSTRSRSTSRSSSARPSLPATSPTSTSSPTGSSASRTATTKPRHRSTGPTPATTSTDSSPASTPTAAFDRPHDLRRIISNDH
jgi:transposase